ncbi:hypothetical protein [Streptomyces sp. NPDC050485]|uniref:hypothetical protein n=1 Tax=Streptomyces sp. NPDC050485 TaxID=3365617 RepID=UPI0037877FD3
MSDRPGLWEQAKFARPDNSWTALALNLVFWTAFYSINLVIVLTGTSYSRYSVMGLLVFLIPILHGIGSGARKLRNTPTSQNG